MSPRIVLTVVDPPEGDEKSFAFEEPAHCLVGRAADCQIQLPADRWHADVSRRHCAFEIAPPGVRVRDLGSCNGTFLNGERIGQRQRSQAPQEVDHSQFEEVELHDGDEVRVGHTVIRVGVESLVHLPHPLAMG